MLNLIGQALGRYHITEQLGEGGMASVFKAYDTSLERFVAIKVIRTDKGQDVAFLSRFQREAKALARLDHPFILKVLDYGEQNGMPYLVMPFVAGGTLKGKMGQPIPAKEAAALLAPIARALEYAHSLGIIHRDIKPANILIGPSGAPLLSDFGIAKILDQEEISTQLTATGVGIGTPDYMAPEQWMGKADPRTDVYALGVVFYEMVTGRRPYTADTPAAVLLKHIQDPLPQPRSFIPDLPVEAEQILFKALAKKTEDRYQEVGSLAEHLESLAGAPHPSLSSAARIYTTPAAHPAETAQKAGIPAAAAPTVVQAAPAAPSAASARRALPGTLIALIAGGALLVVCLLVAGGIFLLRSGLSGLGQNRTPPVAAVEATAPSVVQATQASGQTSPAGAQVTETPGQESFAAAVRTSAALSTPMPEPGRPTPTLPPITSIEGLPPDVPIFADNNGDLMTTKNEGAIMYTFTTKKDVKEVVNFYKEKMLAEGWELISTTESVESSAYMYMYSKGDTRNVMINTSTNDGQGTMINIMLLDQPVN